MPATVPPIKRPRLLVRLADARLGVVVAGGGHGKSTFAEQAAADAGITTLSVDLTGVATGAAPVVGVLRRAVRGAGMGALDAALEVVAEGTDEADLAAAAAGALCDELAIRHDPVLVLIDEVGAVAGNGDRLLADVVRRVAPPHRLLLVGRSLPPEVAEAVHASPGAVRLGAEDLALTGEEIGTLARATGRPIDGVTADAIGVSTGGWPAAVALALASGRHTSSRAPDGVDASLASLLAAAGPGLPEQAAAIAHLPRVDERTSRLAAGDGALEWVLAAGLPVRRRADGWLELPEPVRDALRPLARLEPDRVRAVANAYLDAGEAALALGFLVAAREPDALAATLADRSWHELTVLDASELRAALATLPQGVVERHPRVLLAAARVAESGVHVAWRRELLQRAGAVPATAEDPVLRREVLAERAADASRSGEDTEARWLADEVLSGAGPGEARSRAIALTALGRTKAFSRDPAAMVDAAGQLAEAAALLRPLGEPDLLRTALQVLGYGIHFARGDLDAAIEALREAADLEPGAIRTRAGVQTFLADALVAAGALDDAEAVLRDELGVARRLRDHRLLAYHAWMQASIASRHGDAAAVEAWLAEAERHPADWLAHPTGIEFLADGVDHLARVGLDEEAAGMLARVEARCATDDHEGVEQIALVARAMYGARAGDPIAAERDLVACLSIEQVAPREHWRIHLLRGLAALRAADEERARRHARRAFEMTAAMGHPDLPRILEPGATDRLVPLVSAPGGPGRQQGSGDPVATPEGTSRFGVRVLGRFGVTVAGRPADPPEGRPGQLVKLLAVAGRQVPIDEAVEVLWPETDPDLGRQRLRNVLARVRSTCGELVVRDEEALGLDPGAEVDLARFESDARAALGASGDAREGLIRSALARYAGELLPADRYEEFTAVARERVAVRHVALLDRLAVVTAARGDVDEALSVLEDAIAAEPLDERRYRTAIDIAVSHGRRDRAVRLTERAIAMEAELADEPSDELLAVARSLGMRASGTSHGRGEPLPRGKGE